MCTFDRMLFEYDPEKSERNKVKHGIDFEEADKDALVIAARSDTEPRYMVLGKIDGVFWAAFVTYRWEAIRIISVRRARKQEVKVYEEALVCRRT